MGINDVSAQNERMTNSTSKVIRNNVTKELQSACELYRSCEYHLASSIRGHTRKHNKFLKICFVITLFFAENPAEYSKFIENEYFKGSRQKPKNDAIAKSVLYFVADAKTDKERNPLIKDAKVLDALLREGTTENDFLGRLEKSGGSDQLYRELCARDRPVSVAPRKSIPAIQMSSEADIIQGDRYADPSWRTPDANATTIIVRVKPADLELIVARRKVTIVVSVEPRDNDGLVRATAECVLPANDDGSLGAWALDDGAVVTNYEAAPTPS
jgi:hypothetical protein